MVIGPTPSAWAALPRPMYTSAGRKRRCSSRDIEVCIVVSSAQHSEQTLTPFRICGKGRVRPVPSLHRGLLLLGRRHLLLQPVGDHGGDLEIVLLEHHEVAVSVDADV